MINLTLNVLVKKHGDELESAIYKAVKETRKTLFDTFSEGKEIGDNEITSSSTKTPSTLQLAFCKFYKISNIYEIDTQWNDFIHEIYNIYVSNKPLKKDAFEKLIPNYEKIKNQLSGTFTRQIIRAFGIMLMSLWKDGAVLLGPTFHIPSSSRQNGRKFIHCSHLYTEVLDYFQSFRQPTISGTTKIKTSSGLSSSFQANLQRCGWRLILTTDWHSIEDVNPEDAANFLKAANDHRKGITDFAFFPVPVKEMLSMLIENFGDRVNYTYDDFLQARKMAFGQQISSRIYSPEILTKEHYRSDVENFNLTSVSQNWCSSQIDYIKKRQKKGLKTFDRVKDSLSILNQYLFFHLPEHQNENNLPFSVPDSPIKFTREYIDGTDETPSFLDYIDSGRSSSTVYGHLISINGYFNYVERCEKIEGGNFINPFHKDMDFPLSKPARGTSKSIISQKHFPGLISYSYALLDFLWYLVDSMTNCNERNHENIKNLVANIPGDYDYWIDTDAFGFVPFILHRDKLYPITRIHKSVLAFVNRKIQDIGFVKIPNCNYLVHFITAFETGIRNLHIKWLDADSYDMHIDRSRPLPPICKLNVSSDKVKTKPWDAYVSKRVIKVLDRLRDLRDKYDEPWIRHRYWYDGHVESKFGELKPLFPSGGNDPSRGIPYNESTQSEHFRKILIAFQSFANDNGLYSEPLNIARVETYLDNKGKLQRKYISEITPHSARATVVSNHIKLLPPHVIGKYITGHESEQMIAYYTVLDPAYMAEIEKGQELSVAGLNPLLNSEQIDAIHAEAFNSALQTAVNTRMTDAFLDFGATAFEYERPNGKIVSGISIATSVTPDQLAYNSTHICPYNNICPNDIKLEVGERNCGQCWASIKTVDHLPRINAHIRQLHSMHEEKANEVRQMISLKVNETIIEQHEVERNKIASEEAAWIATSAILEEFRKNIENRDDYLVGKPEIIEKQLQQISSPSSPLTEVLTRIRDAQSYPEYFTPQLQASITRLRNRILAQSGDINAIVNQPAGYDLLDEFRGIIRGICDAANTTVEDLSRAMKKDLPDGNQLLLEIL